MATIRRYEDLARALEASDTSHRANPSTREIAFPTRSRLPGPILVRFERNAPFLGIRQVMVEGIPADRFADLEIALAHVNHQVDVSGFNLDHARGQLYYRVSIPLFDAGIEAEDINRVARGVLGNALEFEPAFTAVVKGRKGAEISEVYRDSKLVK